MKKPDLSLSVKESKRVWEITRWFLFLERGEICEACGILGASLEAHHLTEAFGYYTCPTFALVRVCRACHLEMTKRHFSMGHDYRQIFADLVARNAATYANAIHTELQRCGDYDAVVEKSCSVYAHPVLAVFLWRELSLLNNPGLVFRYLVHHPHNLEKLWSFGDGRELKDCIESARRFLMQIDSNVLPIYVN